MRLNRGAVLMLIAVVAGACADDSPPAATGPDVAVRFARPAGGACSASLGRSISDQQKGLFERTTLKAAQNLWGVVTAACAGNLAQAKEAMLTYVQFTIDQEAGGTTLTPSGFASPAAGTVSHWNSVFAYVDYPAPGLPATVLESTGAAKVIPATATTAEVSIAQKAALKYSPQSTADPIGHLFSIYPLPDNCLTGTNLEQTGKCFEFSASPAVSPGFDVQVGICQPLDEALHGNMPALAHLVSGKTEITEPTPSAYPSLSFCNGTSTTGSMGDGLGGAARRLASLVKSAFTVRRAYAAHGGLGGISGGGLSPFGGVDLLVFSADFSSTAGLPPEAPNVGTWLKAEATPPGSILVQASLGTLTNSPVVLSQGGGNCSTCGGLDLWGGLNSSSASIVASDGLYRVEWSSLQDGPTLKGAPFVLRSSTGAEIARLVYSSQSGQDLLTYNGNIPAGGWIRHAAQRFTILVNLNTRTTSLSIGGQPVAGAQDQPFVSASALDLASVRAEFTGIDSGIMGWDDISVQRLADN
ncbi:MAG: hypothetical protein H0T48_01235 [Gemmatimonadaceae bacterium]|nr:hypothetical protein [Gemmatimonadaceae bacterium]